LISLAQHLKQPNLRDPLPVDPKTCSEIAELTEHINLMIIEGAYAASRSDDGHGRFSLTPQELNKLSNHLTGIINYTQLLLDEGRQGDDKESMEMLNKVRENGERMGSILQKKIGGKKNDE